MTTELNPNVDAPAPQPGSKRKRALLILLVVVLIAGIGWALYYVLVGRWHESTDDAYVQGNVVSITPQATGTVVSIGADDGMKVTAGQVLVRLDPNDARVAYEQAVANLANTVREVRGLYSAVNAGQADIRARQVAVQKARADIARRSGPGRDRRRVGRGTGARARGTRLGEAALSASGEQLSRNRALVDATTIRNQPQVQAAASQLRTAYLNLQRSEILAPVTGFVAKRTVQLGQRVQPGMTLMTIVPLEQLWVEANFKETQLASMRIGQPVELNSDLYGSDVTFKGRLTSLGLGTAARFRCCRRRTPAATGSRSCSVFQSESTWIRSNSPRIRCVLA
jgi:membrane fusion protein (multidrug efflux system)